MFLGDKVETVGHATFLVTELTKKLKEKLIFIVFSILCMQLNEAWKNIHV